MTTIFFEVFFAAAPTAVRPGRAAPLAVPRLPEGAAAAAAALPLGAAAPPLPLAGLSPSLSSRPARRAIRDISSSGGWGGAALGAGALSSLPSSIVTTAGAALGAAGLRVPAAERLLPPSVVLPVCWLVCMLTAGAGAAALAAGAAR